MGLLQVWYSSMRLGVFTASPIAPFLGAVHIPLIHPLKLGISSVAPIVPTATVSDQMGGLIFRLMGLFDMPAAFAIEEGAIL